MNKARTLFVVGGLLALSLPGTLLAQDSVSAADLPQWAASNELVFPENYRDWIFLSAGYGMTYGPAASEADAPPLFDNVFVQPNAYRTFRETGEWPDGTMFVLEIRRASNDGAINVGGKFQEEIAIIEMSVKDSDRFEGGWGYFDFAEGRSSTGALPYGAACYECHATNAAVDNVFVQFYPTLIDLAKEMDVFRETGFLESAEHR